MTHLAVSESRVALLALVVAASLPQRDFRADTSSIPCFDDCEMLEETVDLSITFIVVSSSKYETTVIYNQINKRYGMNDLNIKQQ